MTAVTVTVPHPSILIGWPVISSAVIGSNVMNSVPCRLTDKRESILTDMKNILSV